MSRSVIARQIAFLRGEIHGQAHARVFRSVQPVERCWPPAVSLRLTSVADHYGERKLSSGDSPTLELRNAGPLRQFGYSDARHSPQLPAPTGSRIAPHFVRDTKRLKAARSH